MPPVAILDCYLLNDLEQSETHFIIALDNIQRIHKRPVFVLRDINKRLLPRTQLTRAQTWYLLTGSADVELLDNRTVPQQITAEMDIAVNTTGT